MGEEMMHRADVFFGLHPNSLQVHGHYLKMGGKAFCNSSQGDSRTCVEATRVASELGAPVSANLVLFGLAVESGLLFYRPEDLTRQISRVGGTRLEINLKAFRAGLKA